MTYFSNNQDKIERGGKVVADIFCALLLAAFAIVFFGLMGGLVAFIILEAALLAVDYLVPNADGSLGAVGLFLGPELRQWNALGRCSEFVVVEHGFGY